jgi:hypothetical protein
LPPAECGGSARSADDRSWGRSGRQRVEFTQSDGGLQGVVNKRVMVSVTGSAPLEVKQAALEAMDFKALGDF